MATTVNGVGVGAAANFAGASLTVKSTTNTIARSQAIQRQSSRKTKKKLNYNSKEISSQLLRASKSRNAAMVLTRAKSKVSNLQRCLGTGQYNDSEVRVALAHANRMVKCAKMKLQNLKEEEQLRSHYEREHANKEQQQKNEVKRRVTQKEQEIKTKIVLDEAQQAIKEKSMRQDLLRKKRIHRNAERGKINEADMKYLKEQMNERGNTYSDSSGVMLELSTQAVGISELEMSEHALQLLENQLEQEVALEMGDIGMSTSMSMGTEISSASSEIAGASASVDISI